MEKKSSFEMKNQLTKEELMNITGGGFFSSLKNAAKDWWYGMTHSNGVIG